MGVLEDDGLFIDIDLNFIKNEDHFLQLYASLYFLKSTVVTTGYSSKKYYNLCEYHGIYFGRNFQYNQKKKTDKYYFYLAGNNVPRIDITGEYPSTRHCCLMLTSDLNIYEEEKEGDDIISKCFEEESGLLSFKADNYMLYVRYCPKCGYEAKKLWNHKTGKIIENTNLSSNT